MAMAMLMAKATSGLLLLALALAGCAFPVAGTGATATSAPSPLPETDWFMAAQRGVFTHYLNGLQNSDGRNSQGKNTSWDACVHEFDTEAYAASAAAAHARYAILTVMQGERFMIAPNQVYDNLTGYKPGEACSTRDLVVDLAASLAKRGLRLMLYYTGDGPHLDAQARAGLGWPDSAHSSDVPVEFVQRWAMVLREYVERYEGIVHGWWIDGCYARQFNYTEAKLWYYHQAVRPGTQQMLCLNNGVSHPIASGRVSTSQDFTCGESDDFSDVSAVGRFAKGPKGALSQWHSLGYLGSRWASPGTCVCQGQQDSCDVAGKCAPLTATAFRNYSTAVAAQQGVLTVDLQLFRNGSMNAQQVAFLRDAWGPLAAGQPRAPPGHPDT